MPRVTETPRSLLSHCPDPKCRNATQRSAAGVEVLVERLYQENSVDGGVGGKRGVETSQTYFRFATPDDATCSACGRQLELSDSPRPRYPNLSGFDPTGLLTVDAWHPGDRSAEVEAMVDRISETLSDV